MSDPKSVLQGRRMAVGGLFLIFFGVNYEQNLHVSHISLTNTSRNKVLFHG